MPNSVTTHDQIIADAVVKARKLALSMLEAKITKAMASATPAQGQTADGATRSPKCPPTSWQALISNLSETPGS